MVFSAAGLREGWYAALLDPAVRDADPLLSACREIGAIWGRDTALPPAVDGGVPHRFDASLPVVDELAATVAALPEREVTGCRLHVTARTTPATDARLKEVDVRERLIAAMAASLGRPVPDQTVA